MLVEVELITSKCKKEKNVRSTTIFLKILEDMLKNHSLKGLFTNFKYITYFCFSTKETFFYQMFRAGVVLS